MAGNPRAGASIAPSDTSRLVSYAIRDVVLAAREEEAKGKT
jgi:hypothetical protein